LQEGPCQGEKTPAPERFLGGEAEKRSHGERLGEENGVFQRAVRVISRSSGSQALSATGKEGAAARGKNTKKGKKDRAIRNRRLLLGTGGLKEIERIQKLYAEMPRGGGKDIRALVEDIGETVRLAGVREHVGGIGERKRRGGIFLRGVAIT